MSNINHPRAIIRNSIIDLLTTNVESVYLTDAKDRIYSNRSLSLFDQSLPAILVYSLEETILEDNYKSDGYGPLKRDLEIVIEAMVDGDDFDDKLDKLSIQIETALDDFEIEGRKSDLIKLKSTEIESSIQNDQVYGTVKLRYSVIYRSEAKQPICSGIVPQELYNRPPSLMDITRQNPIDQNTNRDSLVFRARFSEEIQKIDASDFVVNGTSAVITDIKLAKHLFYDITISGGDLVYMNGIVSLGVASGQNITDLLGEPFSMLEPAINETYILHNVMPILISSTPSNKDTDVSRTTTISLNFDKDIILSGTINLVDKGNKFGNIGGKSFNNFSSEISVSNSQINIDLSSNKLKYAEEYDITWLEGAITDFSGNKIFPLNENVLGFETINLEKNLSLSSSVAPAANIGPGPEVSPSTLAVGSPPISILNADSIVIASDINIPAKPSGLIIKCGGAGRGQFVGFNLIDGVFRVRGGNGGKPVIDDGVYDQTNNISYLDVPISNIPSGNKTLMVEYNQPTRTVRAWLDEVELTGIRFSTPELKYGLWAGGASCTFNASGGSLVGETGVKFNGSSGDFRIYNSQIVD
jgi:hypothetical protein